MFYDTILPIYLIIGLFYAIYNGAVRKIQTDGDMFLPLVWWFGVGLCLLSRFVQYVINLNFNRKL